MLIIHFYFVFSLAGKQNNARIQCLLRLMMKMTTLSSLAEVAACIN